MNQSSAMSRTPWILDGRMFAKKIKHSAPFVNWRTDVTLCCPNCNFNIDNNSAQQEWPGLPFGVKFDPTDQELLKHLQAKAGVKNLKLHPFIDEFIMTLEGDNGICSAHPERLPGIKKDGSSIHFFHKTAKAYATGTRKRRKVQNEDAAAGEDLRWHKTGKTRPVVDNGEQMGCKKIMVLYITPGKGIKAEKTNWVMHQYHLGTEEQEKDSEYVLSKIFYQQQTKPEEAGLNKGGPLTPSSVTPPRLLKQHSFIEEEKEVDIANNEILQDSQFQYGNYEQDTPNEYYAGVTGDHDLLGVSTKEDLHAMQTMAFSGGQLTSCNAIKEDSFKEDYMNSEIAEATDKNPNSEFNEEVDCFSQILPDITLDSQLFGSQFLADSQELMQNTLLCAETFKKQSPQEPTETERADLPGKGRVADGESEELRTPPSPTLENIVVDSLPDIQFSNFQESQFSSQDSWSGWLRKNLNFSDNDSQNNISDKFMEDSQGV